MVLVYFVFAPTRHYTTSDEDWEDFNYTFVFYFITKLGNCYLEVLTNIDAVPRRKNRVN